MCRVFLFFFVLVSVIFSLFTFFSFFFANTATPTLLSALAYFDMNCFIGILLVIGVFTLLCISIVSWLV